MGQISDLEYRKLLSNLNTNVNSGVRSANTSKKAKRLPGEQNKTELFYEAYHVKVRLSEGAILGYIAQPLPIILQDVPKITYKPDFIEILPNLTLRVIEVKPQAGQWKGVREDDSLKMRLIAGKYPGTVMMLALVDMRGKKITEKVIS